ncbi:MAG TPA: hypothetical protein ENK52_01870 [Saprospiraceae bacterium]|nr:hypothetical protein [Saprospiraceae bacterium]
MKDNLIYITMLLLFLLLTSCFEITEEVDVKVDGSGTTVLTINLNESKDNLKSYINKGEVEGVALPPRYKMEMGIARLQSVLTNTKGISDVKVESNFEEYIFVFRAKFNNVNALNDGINNLIETLVDSKYEIPKKDNFSFANNQFERFFVIPIITKLIKNYLVPNVSFWNLRKWYLFIGLKKESNIILIGMLDFLLAKKRL